MRRYSISNIHTPSRVSQLEKRRFGLVKEGGSGLCQCQGDANDVVLVVMCKHPVGHGLLEDCFAVSVRRSFI